MFVGKKGGLKNDGGVSMTISLEQPKVKSVWGGSKRVCHKMNANLDSVGKSVDLSAVLRAVPAAGEAEIYNVAKKKRWGTNREEGWWGGPG